MYLGNVTKWRTNKANIHAEELANINVQFFSRCISISYFTHQKKNNRGFEQIVWKSVSVAHNAEKIARYPTQIGRGLKRLPFNIKNQKLLFRSLFYFFDAR